VNTELQEALLHLGPPSANAGKLGVLRVLCSWPAKPDLDTLKKAVKGDEDKHPGATLNLADLPMDKEAREHLLSSSPQVLGKRKTKKDGRVAVEEIDDLRLRKGRSTDVGLYG
jgi:hypothetical protein